MNKPFPGKYPQSDHAYLGSIVPFASLDPIGVTVHYTASRGIGGTIKELVNKSLGYHIIIDRDGTVYQCAEFTGRLNHAGKADWRGHSPNREHIAVALVSWGWVKELAPGIYQSWAGTAVDTKDCIERDCRWWDVATNVQELALLRFLRWTTTQGIDPSHICGHDECALPPGRKADPGGVLSINMEKFRTLLQDDLS